MAFPFCESSATSRNNFDSTYNTGAAPREPGMARVRNPACATAERFTLLGCSCKARVCFRQHLVVDGHVALDFIRLPTSRTLLLSHFVLVDQGAQRIKQGSQTHLRTPTMGTLYFVYTHLNSDCKANFRADSTRSKTS
jgi:hypothetical protein